MIQGGWVRLSSRDISATRIKLYPVMSNIRCFWIENREMVRSSGGCSPPQDSAFTALRGQFDPVVIVRESPGQLQTGEGQPVTVLKRQSGSSHEMAPMAEVLTHRARTAGHCPRQGICERWLHKERGVVELGSFLGPFSIYRYTIYNTQHTLPGQSVTGDDSPFLPISESNPPPAPK